MNSDIYIPPRFREAIVGHVLCNRISDRIGVYPLILGIHGPPGVGKTFQCEYVLGQMGIEVFHLSPADMEHEDAGTPAQVLRETYAEAASTKGLGSVLLLNDIDAGLGDWGLQGTVNRQLLFGELMRLSDRPSTPDNGLKRVPIVMTGNDLTKLYRPLLRPGRACLFSWKPSIAEKAAIVGRIFPEYGPEICAQLLDQHSEKAVSFFVHLRASLIQELVIDGVKEVPSHRLISAVRELWPDALRLSYSSTDLLLRAKLLGEEPPPINHLQP